MNALVPLPQICRLALSGRSILFFGEAMPRLAAYLIGRVALQGSPVTLVDAAQSFDPYLVARVGRYRGLDLRVLLERIRLSRAFTCHQLATLLCETLPATGSGGEPLFVLGPCALFYDDQVALTERRNLFKQVAASLAFLGRRGRGVFLFQGPVSSRVKNLFYGRELAARVELVIRVRYGEQGIEGLLQHRTAVAPRRG
jgi:hypothetical protein